MKKATLVLATAVAFLLSGPVFAARKVVDMPTTGTILKGSTSSIAENGVLKVSGGALVGEYIPGVKNALAIVPETKIATAAISGLAKNVIKGGVAGLVVGAAFDELIDGLDWVMTDGTVGKKSDGAPVPYDPSTSNYYFISGDSNKGFSTAQDACDDYSARKHLPRNSLTALSSTVFVCKALYSNGQADSEQSISRSGNGCPGDSVYSPTGACISKGAVAPLQDSDFNDLDGFVKGKDGVWQRDLTTALCNGNEDCYKTLSPQTSLTGPSTVNGSPQTVTTTSPSGSVTTSVKTPTTTLTYGPNYYDYSTSTTTTTNNGGDTTTVTDDTDTSFPVPPDIFGGANDGLGGIRDSIPTTAPSTSPIPYMAWWSFSQSCNEITFIIPVYGAVTTALCPIYKQYIWPVLYFFFAVFTWLTCFEIWRKTVMRVRAS